MSSVSPERNLLFGLLALQNGFITRDQLVAAFGSWTADKRRQLDQILEEHGAIDGAKRDLLSALVNAHVAQHGGDPLQSLAKLSSIGPSARHELERLNDVQLHTCLSQLPPVEPRQPEDVFATVSYVGEKSTGGRFIVLRPHARGGLGQVAVALDTELHREVALKEIQPEHADEPASRTRFVREAEITGGLEHPGIVPVYGVGAYGDGRPYYAMKFVKGRSLKTALEEFHQQHPTPTAADYQGVEFRQLLQRFLDVCNAMQYAHDRGVLHRDLKPGNIMLGQYGETLVIDWGLAKPLAEADDTLPINNSHEKPLIPQSSLSGSGAETQPGSAIGTPHYMSPEQAAGQLDDLGPATDVYSLGATLYHILTGKPPIEGKDLGELLQCVVRGEIPAPRKFVRAIPAPVEAICLKAMALSPSDRYASPRALASDLEHWLADDRVTAYAESWWQRLGRWSRRNKAWTRAGGAALLGVMVISLIASWLINAARQSEAEAAQREARALALAAYSQSFESALDQLRWTPEHLKTLENLIAKLASISPEQGDSARQRLGQRYAERIQQQIDQPRLESDEYERIAAAIDDLASRAAELAAPLRDALALRRRSWSVLFDLEPPFADAAPLFDAGRIRIQGETLWADESAAGGDAPPTRTPLLVTTAGSAGAVRLRSAFGNGWKAAQELGVSLNHGDDYGYEFLLTPELRRPAGEDKAPLSFQESFERGGGMKAQIVRNGIVLREQIVAGGELPTAELRLMAVREGDRLTLQIQDREPFEFLDPYPLGNSRPGVFAVRLASDVPLARLTAWRYAEAPQPSPLEKGDELYAAGEIEAALAYYEHPAQQSGSQESRYKQAICLVALKRLPEAARLWEALSVEPGKRWPVAAAIQLWSVYVLQDRFDDADILFDRLSHQLPFEQLVSVVAPEVRERILSGYQRHIYRATTSIGLSTFDPQRIRNLERMVSLHQFLKVSRELEHEARGALARALEFEGRLTDALDVWMYLGRELPSGFGSMSACARLLRLQGKPREALERLERFPEEHPLEWKGLQPELQGFFHYQRACCHAALEDWDVAGRIVDELKQQTGAFLSAADENRNGAAIALYQLSCLMQGFLRERRGDADGALAAWRAGTFPDSPGLFKRSWSHRYYFIMRSLTGEYDADDFAAMLADVSANLTPQSVGIETSPYAAILSLFKGDPARLAQMGREVYRSKYGRDFARKTAFDVCPAFEDSAAPLMLTAYVFAHDAVARGDVEDEVDQLLWEMAQVLYRAYAVRAEISAPQVVQVAMTWRGMTNVLGWGGVAPLLRPELRGPIAYVMAYRFLNLGKNQEAAEFFRTALADAPPESVLARVAQQGQELLQAGKGRVIVRNDSAAPVKVAIRTADGPTTQITVDPAREQTLDLAPGTYEIALEDAPADIKLSKDHIDVVLCGRYVVRILPPPSGN